MTIRNIPITPLPLKTRWDSKDLNHNDLPTLPSPDTDHSWRDRADCLNSGINFFSGHAAKSVINEVCGYCDVTKECLDFALRNRITDGVWGGTTENERKEMLGLYRRPPVVKEVVPVD